MYSGQSPSTLPSPRMTVPRPSETGVEVLGTGWEAAVTFRWGSRTWGLGFLGGAPTVTAQAWTVG